MKGFEPVTLGWKGESYTIPADRQLGLIAQIEDALAGGSGQPALIILTRAGGPSYSRLAAAYGAALRYAGAQVGDEEVYLSIVEGFADGGSDVAQTVQTAILALLAIIAPPVYSQIVGGSDSKKKPNPARKSRAQKPE